MKLYMSENSPYARLVRIVAREARITDALEEIVVNPRDPETGLWQVNPVARIPALVLDDGTALVESALICRYLDDAFNDGALHRPVAATPERARRLGLATAILDKGMIARVEKGRDAAPDTAAFVETHLAAVRRGLDALEAAIRKGGARDGAEPGQAIDMADIAVVTAVAWIALRHPDIDLVTSREALTAYCAPLARRPAFAATEPPG